MSDKPTRSGGGSGLATLPEWPEEPVAYSRTAELDYHTDLAEAALARMEDLAAEVEQLRDEFLIGNPRHAEWLEIINAKLAACERRKS